MKIFKVDTQFVNRTKLNHFTPTGVVPKIVFTEKVQ